MSALPLALVLAASLLHVGWNALAKDAGDKLAFLWLAILPAAAIGVVWLGLSLGRGGLSPVGLTCAGSSAAVHAVYFWLLAAAYGEGDLSFVYPYARGLGSAGATAGGVLVLGEAPSVLGWFGIALAASAMFVEAGGRARHVSRASSRALGLTLATAAFVATYLVIDKVGVGHLEPPLYLASMLAGAATLLAPLALRGGRAKRELRRAKSKVIWAALFLACGYGAVLAAMARAPVSYVVAARASGIVAGALAGLWLFEERLGAPRWLAVGLITAGVVCVSLA